ncbi:MAG: hypothetical protein ACYCXG_00370 [Acidiferrobacter sp.]
MPASPLPRMRGVFLTLGLLMTGAAAAHCPAAALRREIRALRAQIAHLQSTATPTNAPTGAAGRAGVATPPIIATRPAPPPAPTFSARQRWRQLRRGQSAAVVRRDIGPPLATIPLPRGQAWTYAYRGIGRGSIIFDQSGHVIDWRRPPFGGFW